MSKYKLNEGFDLEDERDVLLKAADYKCRLRRSDIEEALEPADLIEDMEYIYNKLCGKYDDVNIKYWRFTTDGIMVRKLDGQVVRIEDDEFDKFYSKSISESNELEKRAKHHRKHQDGMSPFCSLGESNYGYKSGDRYYGGLPAEPVYNDVRDAKYWKELVQYFIDTVPNYSGYRIAGRSRVVVILDTPNGKEKFDLREFDHLDSAEEAVKVLDDMFKSMVNTNSNDIDESLEVYNGTNIADFDYSNIDLDNSREIGLHCGTEQACKDKGYKCINKLNISNENILALDTDMAGYWSDPAVLKHLNNVFSDSEISSLRKKMRAFSGEETGTKYKNYSKIIRDALLDKGYNVISYPNSVEDVGSTSYIILDSSIINKPMAEAKKKKKHICDLGGNTLSEGIWAYQTYIDRKPGEKQPSKTLMYGGNFVTSRSPYRKEQFGADWKRHIRKIIDWATENNPSLHRMTQDYRLDNFGKNANSEEAYISAIEDGIKKGNYELLAEGVSVLQEFKKRKKKKGIDSINTNAGNVEYNNAMFNHMNNAAESPSTNPTGPMGESIDDIDDSFDWSIYDYGDSDDYMDDYEYSNTYGGDLTYCPVCNRKLSYDEDGDTYCDNCGESTWSLVQKRRELDRSNMDEDIDGNSDFNAYAPQFGSTASKFIDGVNTVKNLGKTQIQ